MQSSILTRVSMGHRYQFDENAGIIDLAVEIITMGGAIRWIPYICNPFSP